METFRISFVRHATKLSSSGKANRWNKAGETVIYVGSSRSLSTLEFIVHRNSIKPLVPFKVMTISLIDDQSLYEEVKIKDLPENWRAESAYRECQEIGSRWYNSKKALFLKIPSAVIIQEFNYMINTEHPEFLKKNVRLVRTEDYFWDQRLY